MLGNAKLSIMLQVTLAVVDAVVYHYLFNVPCKGFTVRFYDHDHYALRGTSHYWGYVLGQAFLLAGIAVFAWAWEGLMISQAEALVEAKESLQASTRVRRLLSGMCDVVVLLDENLQWLEPCPKLGHLLLHGSSDSIRNSQFMDLLAVADREHFQNCIRNEIAHQKTCDDTTNAVPPSALHTHLLDANSTLVAVEIFISYCSDIDGDTLLLGILQGEERIPNTVERVANLPFRDLFSHVHRESAIDTCGQSDCSRGSMTDVAVVCFAFVEGLPIESCSIGFASMCGRGQLPRGSLLVDILDKPEDFGFRFQTLLNNSASIATRAREEQSFRTYFPVIGNAFLELVCSCRLEDEVDVDVLLNGGLIRLVFDSFSVRHRKVKLRSASRHLSKVVEL
jgi:hypothetical protein